MSLTHNAPIGFVPTTKPETVRPFFEGTLGLTFVSEDQFAFVFRMGPAPGTMLRIVRAQDCTPAPFTIFGWETQNIEVTVDELTAKGIEFLRFGFFPQDDRGIWNAPGGDRIAWFKDPSGNTLSVSQHV